MLPESTLLHNGEIQDYLAQHAVFLFWCEPRVRPGVYVIHTSYFSIFQLRAKVQAAPLAVPAADSCGRSATGAYVTQRLMVFSTPK